MPPLPCYDVLLIIYFPTPLCTKARCEAGFCVCRGTFAFFWGVQLFAVLEFVGIRFVFNLDKKTLGRMNGELDARRSAAQS